MSLFSKKIVSPRNLQRLKFKKNSVFTSISVTALTLALITIGWWVNKSHSLRNSKPDWRYEKGTYKALEVKSIKPTQGSTNGNTQVTIVGRGFDKNTQVYFGFNNKTHLRRYPAKIVSAEPTSLTIKTPKHPSESVDVIVQKEGIESVSPNQFTFLGPEPFQYKTRIESIETPNNQYILGKPIKLTIKGSGFAKTNELKFGLSTIHNVISDDGRTIICDIPPYLTIGSDQIPLSPDEYEISVIANNKESNTMILKLLPNSG